MKIGLDYAYYNKAESNIIPTKHILDPKIILTEIGTNLLKKLENYGFKIINCSPPFNGDSTDIINDILNIAKREYMDLFVSITLNSFSNSTRNGCEILVNSTTDSSYSRAKKIQNKLHTLGYSNRGIIKTDKIKLLNELNCPSILIQCFYSTNHWDCKRYNKDLITDAIFKALIKEDTYLQNYKNLSS